MPELTAEHVFSHRSPFILLHLTTSLLSFNPLPLQFSRNTMVLVLPPELRLRIYDYLLTSLPLSTPPSQFTGLLYACRLINQEFEYVITKRMQSYLQDVQKRCAADDHIIKWAPLNTFNDVYNLRVFRAVNPRSFQRGDPFMALFYLHLGTFVIKLRREAFYSADDDTLAFLKAPTPTQIKGSLMSNDIPRRILDTPSKRRQYIHVMNLSRWIGSRDREENVPAARRIVCEWSMDSTGGRSTGLRHMILDPLRKRGLWTLEVFDDEEDEGMVSGCQYSRTDMNPGKYRLLE